MMNELVVLTLQWVEDTEEVDARSGQMAKREEDKAPGDAQQTGDSQHHAGIFLSSASLLLSKLSCTMIQNNSTQWQKQTCPLKRVLSVISITSSDLSSLQCKLKLNTAELQTCNVSSPCPIYMRMPKYLIILLFSGVFWYSAKSVAKICARHLPLLLLPLLLRCSPLSFLKIHNGWT